jgi:hypothetical protein
MGLYCLQDYIQLMKFQNNYKLDEGKLFRKFKALFYIGVIHCCLKQYKYIIYNK